MMVGSKHIRGGMQRLHRSDYAQSFQPGLIFGSDDLNMFNPLRQMRELICLLPGAQTGKPIQNRTHSQIANGVDCQRPTRGGRAGSLGEDLVGIHQEYAGGV